MNLREAYVQKGILGIILAVALAWLIFFTTYVPFAYHSTSDELQAARDELQMVAGELQRLESAAKRLPQIQEELATLERKWQVLRSLLPKETEMSNLLTDVTTAGLKAGIQFSLFEPGQAEPYDLYVRYPIQVAVTGGYHQVGRFMDNLCNMDRLVGISDITIEQLSEGEEVVTVEASGIISAYTYSEDSRVSDLTPGDQTQKPSKKPKE